MGRKREGRVSKKEAFKGAGGFGGPAFLDRGVEDVEKEIWRSGFLGQRGGGCRERDQRRRGEFERGEGGEKVRSFGERRLRSLEESELLNFSFAASMTGRWPTP